LNNHAGAIDQGTTSTRFMVFDQDARVCRRSERTPANLSATRLGRARPARNPAPDRRSYRRGPCPWRFTRFRSRCHWNYQSNARPRSFGNAKPGSQLPMPSSGKTRESRTTCVDSSTTGGQDRLRPQTGSPLSTYFSGLKLRWLLQNIPGAREKTASGDLLFGNVDTFPLFEPYRRSEGRRARQ